MLCRGGIYFTIPKNIHCFLNIGIYIREVTIPEGAEMVEDHGKWRASKVILGERRDLGEIGTWGWLVENGVNVNECLLFMCRNERLDIIKFFVESGANIHWNRDYFLRYAAYGNKIDIVRYFINLGCDVHIYDDIILKYAEENGDAELIEYIKGL
jgi:hypothetical protein